MGIIQAAINAVSGDLGDQYGEAIQPPASLSRTFVMAPGVRVRPNDPRNTNVNNTSNRVSNGSLIHVWPGTMMLLVDGGKIISACAEPGYFEVSNAAAPSIWAAADIKGSLMDAFERLKFGGGTPRDQRVYYINMQEIQGIKYGTANPMNYFDSMYGAEVFIRARGTYSFQIINPIKFFNQVVSKGAALNNEVVDFNDIKEQFNGEFLTALEDSLGKLSMDGVPFNQVKGHSLNLTKYLADALDEDWKELRGMEIKMVAFTSSYTEETQKTMGTRLQAMSMADPNAQAGYMALNVAEGLKAAGSNQGGAMTGFLGMGMGMNMTGNIMQGYQHQQQNYQHPQGHPQYGQQQQLQGYPQQNQPQAVVGVATPSANTWKCECGADNTGKFCPQCGKQKPEPAPQPSANGWVCSCGTQNSGKFCMECGSPMPAPAEKLKCSQCGFEPAEGSSPKFCPNCGNKM